MNKIIKSFIGVLAGFLIMDIVVFADSSVSILETYTGDSDISVYIKGSEVSEGEIRVQIATTEANKVSVQSVSELDVPMKTLVMIDNSLSISSSDRDKIAEFLQNLISDRMNNEEICIATFSEEINILTDYTSDYASLKKAVDGITYQNQETYLTDVLYDLISTEYIQNNEDVYRRIVVVSDGVDNKFLGYTKNELTLLLKDNPIPIYTIGCTNSKNNDELENMFALSRTTLAAYFLLNEIEDTLEITDTLNQDRAMIKLTITPSVEILDGSKKSIKITLSDGTVLTTEAFMPQQIYVSQPTATPLSYVANDEVETEIVTDEAASDIHYFILIIVEILIVVVVVTILFVLLVIKRKKKKVTIYEPYEEKQTQISDLGEKTVMSGCDKRDKNDGETFYILKQGTAYQVVLTDMKSPAKSFQAPLNKAIVIGRKKEWCDVVFDYESSVSRKHCEITVEEGRFFVKDLESSYGTYVNDSKVLTKAEIFPGNKLTLGQLEVRFEVRE